MLTFDETKHEYRWNGKTVSSVTRILEPLIDYSMIRSELLERSRLLGQAVHKMTELHDQDDLDEGSLTEEMHGYLSAWKQFRSDSGFIPTTIETRVYHPTYDYAGTSDRTGMVRGVNSVIDIKKMMTLGPVIGLQLAAYKEAHNVEGAGIINRYALGLRIDGTYRLEPYTDANDFAAFVSLLTLRNWKLKHGIQT